MAFRKFLGALGKRAPGVETVVENPGVHPGGTVECTVTVQGGGADVDIERLRLDLVVRAEDREADGSTAWRRPYSVTAVDLSGFRLAAGETVTHKVALRVPWEMPLTHGRGRPVRGGRAAVRTELAVDKAVDKGDFDEIAVHALPAQDAILQAFEDLGFRLHESEVKLGALSRAPHMRARQTERFWQEIDFFFPESWGQGRQELETVFIAREDSLDVHPGGHPPVTFDYADPDPHAWTATLDQHVRAYWRAG
ncbi:sporulation protein [Streptomyces ziwulingensis]|uniref:Sporulation protein n=1 Tax=Streptomyces ziwulingensis TaxID=1045501 RepID=A0ABP9CXV9_9ACTN